MNARFVALLSNCLLLLLLSGCGKDVHLQADAITDRANTPVLAANQVTTLISDSGITRYRITASSWNVYDKANPAHWEFIQGIYLEKFNALLEVEASLQSNYAYYETQSERWLLRGDVVARNEAGERFDTPELNWDQQSQTIYSDSSITITKATSIIQGIGFRSNQSMTQYTILHPTGVFPIEE